MKLLYITLLISVGLTAQNFDFYCYEDPTPYWDSFKVEAKNHNILIDPDFSLTHVFGDGDGNPLDPYVCNKGGNAAAATLCTDNATVWINKEFWKCYPGYESFFKTVVMYHEYGHAYFDYTHPKDSEGNVTQGYNGEVDIMGYSSDLTALFNDWTAAKERFFAGTNHTIHSCSNKGVTVIKD